jgi:hypothetical protein
MKYLFPIAALVAPVFSAQNCANADPKPAKIETAAPTPAAAPMALPAGFNGYWYQGKAELSTYDVVQERYGETRRAEQINVFVTEDLSRQKQVKLDDPANAGNDRAPVLKLNTIRRFETGIYDYSLMQSVFTPMDGSPTLKVTTTVQDWCGHVFMQTNLGQNEYRTRGYSYFEQEGDQDLRVPLALLEDELWTRLRLNPSAIATGPVNVVPSAFYVRLRHKPGQAQNADLQIEKGENESTLRLRYAAIPRTLSIRFETAFPHKILGWEETNDGKTVSKGSLKATRMSAYWSENGNAFSGLRDSLRIGY